jgi:mannan endo-1,4-beta-mannosidase
MCDDGYEELQQPSGGYSEEKQSWGGYGTSQNPSSSYVSKDAAGGYSDEKESGGGYGSSQNPPSSYASKDAATSTSSTGFGNGINLQPSYYPLDDKDKGDVDLGWGWMRQFDTKRLIKSVRIEIGPGQVMNAQRWIKEAVANGYVPIATYHIATDQMKHTDEELLEAAKWWVSNYHTLAGSNALTINLINEWGDRFITANHFADTYNKAIKMVRSTYSGRIIVDAPGSGQAIQTAALAITGSDATIEDPKIILSAHIYRDAWNPSTQDGLKQSDLDVLARTGVKCMVGEFGETSKKGGYTPNWAALVNYAKSKYGWDVFGWAWNGDNTKPAPGSGPSDYPAGLNMVSPQFRARVAGKPQTYTRTNYFDTIYPCLEYPSKG